MDTFAEGGLSGSSASKSRKQLQENYADLFELSERCGEMGLEVAKLLPFAQASRQVVVSQFFARALSHFQSAILIAETGMAIESLTLSRGLLETCFVMLAIAEDAVTPLELLGHDNAMRLKQANALRKSTQYPNIEPYRAILDEYVGSIDGAKEISFHEFAKRGNALAAYDGIYRHLSHHALHATVSAVDDYLVKGVAGKLHVEFRPIIEKTAAALLTGCVGILIAAFACDKAKITNPMIASTLTGLWIKYQTLYAEHNPWGEEARSTT